jgi:dipeptidyl aminopeptidase/acylaminoacyl peptidase
MEEDAQAIADMKYYPSILDASLHWSPDGHTLAFVAAIDDASYDLYSYDTHTSEVSQLTDGPKQEFILDWSPDGRWIVYMEADYPSISTTNSPGFGPTPSALRVISTDGNIDKKLYDVDVGREVILGWLSSDSFVVYNTLPPELLPSDLRNINVTSGKISSFFSGEFADIALDEASGVFALTIPPHYRSEWDYGSGLFLVNIGEKEPQQIKEDFWGEVDWLPEVGRFLACLGPDMQAFTIGGEIVANYEGERCHPHPSPDGQWLAFGVKEYCRSFLSRSPDLRLFNMEGEVQGNIAAEGAYGFFWRPDSEGIYFMVRNQDAELGDEGYFGQLMYVSVDDNKLVVAHPNPGAYFYDWVAP